MTMYLSGALKAGSGGYERIAHLREITLGMERRDYLCQEGLRELTANRDFAWNEGCLLRSE